MILVISPMNNGSSPLARGGPLERVGHRVEPRLIPAGAGRTQSDHSVTLKLTAHPRWRGEDLPNHPTVVRTSGSSPLARGGQFAPVAFRDVGGLIPAGAGRTMVLSSRRIRRTAHPRWRGEDSRRVRGACRRPGSSPLARGGPGSQLVHPRRPGLIPAGAGRTLTVCLLARGTRAHPRWRGEDSLTDDGPSRIDGSSPLARGGPRRLRRPTTATRLIPAGAGRTWCQSPAKTPRRAHPRWRGEDVCQHLGGHSCAGSSPLARGGRVVTAVVLVGDGLIPAGAGRTQSVRISRASLEAHPRWRGEDSAGRSMNWISFGSSPLARGGRSARQPSAATCGLIPAGAGRTRHPTRR